MVDDRFALSPVSTRIEISREVIGENEGCVALWELDGPVGIDNSTHEASSLLARDIGELDVLSSDPGGVRVGVDCLDVSGEIERHFVLESLNKIEFFTELDVLASLERVGKDNEFLVVHEVVDAFLELGELLVESLDLCVFTLGGKLNGGLAEFADVV